MTNNSAVKMFVPKTDNHSAAEEKVDLRDEANQEAYEVLLSLAKGKTGSIPPKLIVEAILGATKEFDWAVRKDAYEAVLRRFKSAHKSKLRVAAKSRKVANSNAYMVLGRYTLVNESDDKKKNTRPYETIVHSVDPLRGICSCRDYLSNSLGLCKHLLVCYEQIFASKRHHQKALQEQEIVTKAKSEVARLVFSPYRPGKGQGDILKQICWMDKLGNKPEGMSPKAIALVKSRFSTSSNGKWLLEDTYAGNATSRLALVNDLLAIQGSPRVLPEAIRDFVFDPAIRALLQYEKAKLEPIAKKLPSASDAHKLLKSLHVKLYPYQLAGVERFLKSGSLLLADEMGLGKTAQAIAVCHVLQLANVIKRTLIVVPAPLKSQWKREWETFTDIPIQIIEGSPEERVNAYQKCRSGILLVNYEQMIRDLSSLLSWKPDFMILDEAQRIKNWATKTASCVKMFNPDFRLVLTGTPMENRLDELASLLDWIEPFAMEPKWRLTSFYSLVGDGEKSVIGAKNLETLKQRIEPGVFRRRRSEVLGDLPGRTDAIIPIPMTGDQQIAHDDLSQPIANIISRGKTRPLSTEEFLRLMRLLTTQRIICNGLELCNFKTLWPELGQIRNPSKDVINSLNSPKIREFREIIEQVVGVQKRKVVVFSQWRQMLLLASWSIEGVLAESGMRSVFFTGQEGNRRRTHNLVDFHDDPSAAVLFCTDAGGVGLNLQKAASCCVILDLPWNPAVLEQRIGRIYRNGQKSPVDVYQLVCSTGIESRIDALVGSKRKIFNGLFDEGTDTVSFDKQGRFCERLERIIEPLVPGITPGDTNANEDETVTENDVGSSDQSLPDLTEEAMLDVPHTSTTKTSFSKQEQPPEDRSDFLTSSKLNQVFSTVKITRSEDGHLQIDAPPEAANAIGFMFQAMADLMKNAGQ